MFLKDLLSRYENFLPISLRINRSLRECAEIYGVDLSGATVKTRGRDLLVYTNPAYKQKLIQHQTELLNALNQKLGKNLFDRLV